MTQESKILGITVRGVIALLVITTACAMSVMKIPIVEPFYTLIISVASFYMGSRSNMMIKKDDLNGTSGQTP